MITLEWMSLVIALFFIGLVIIDVMINRKPPKPPNDSYPLGI